MVILGLAFELLIHGVEGGMWELVATALALFFSIYGLAGGCKAVRALWVRYLTGLGSSTWWQSHETVRANHAVLLRLLLETLFLALLVCPPYLVWWVTAGVEENNMLYGLHVVALVAAGMTAINNRLGRDL